MLEKLNVNMDGSVLEEKPSFTMLGLIFSSQMYWGSHVLHVRNQKVFSLFVLLLYISCKEKFFIEEFFIEHYTEEI